jgi:hypothetical protein
MDGDLIRIFKFLKYKLRNRAIEEQELLRTIEESLEVAKQLDIADEKEVIRFIELQFNFSKFQLQSQFIQEALVHTLANVEWSAKKRLDFIDEQILDRKPDA